MKKINKELKKDNRQFRIDFDEDAYKYFNEVNYNYFEREGCIADDGGLFYFKMHEEIYALDRAIKNNTNNKKLKFMSKK